ncbi:hypothetical protein Tco_1185641, partial [Tanacetum coccineum]
MSNNQDRDLVLRRKKEKSLDYNNLFLGEYKYSSLALDREEMRDEKEEIGSLETRSNNVSDQEIYIYRQENPMVTDGGPDVGVALPYSRFIAYGAEGFLLKGSWSRMVKIGKEGKSFAIPSIWLDNVREMEQLNNHSTDLIGFIHKKMVNGADTSFWEDENVGYSLRRIPRGGIKHVQFLEFLASMEGVSLVDMGD